MLIELTPEHENMVKQQMALGHYNSPQEVVEEALSWFEEQMLLDPLPLSELRQQIQVGLDEAARGEGLPFDRAAVEDIKRRGYARLTAEQDVL